MTSRKSRSLKTADKMAAYKAAIVRNEAPPRPGSRRSSPRTSPRIKKGMPRNSTSPNVPESSRSRGCKENRRSSPRGKFKQTLDTPAAGEKDCRALDSSSKGLNDVDKTVIPETPPRGTRATNCTYLQESCDNTGDFVDDVVKDSEGFDKVPNCFDDLEVVPETPPRNPRAAARKRVLPPRITRSPTEGSSEDEEYDESLKPSKKRKTYQTPPRVEGSSAVGIENATKSTADDHLGARVLNMSAAENAEMLDYGRHGFDDEEFVPSVPSAKNPYNLNREVRETSLQRRRFHGEKCGAERPAKEGAALEMVTVSTATVSRLFENLSTKLLSQVEVITSSMRREQIAEVRKIADGLTASVAAEVQHLEGIFKVMTRGMKGKCSMRTGGKTSLSDWEEKLNDLTSDTELIFNKEFLARLLCFNAPLKAVDVYKKHGESDAERASMSAQTMLFSLQPGDKKFNYSGTIGRLHIEIKFTIIQNAFFNVCRDSFSLFRSSSGSRKPSNNLDDGGEGGLRIGKAVGNCIRRPSWLEPGKINLDHINDARNFLERPNQSRKNKIRDTPTPRDVGSHGALRVYRLLGNHLHNGRSALRTAFFQGVGYLLVRWADHIGDTSQNSLQMSVCNGDEDLSLQLEDIPYTEQCTFTVDSKKASAVDARNFELLNNLFADWPGMVLAVEHDVHVVTGNGVQRKHIGGERRTIHRLINLIDVACDVCVEYCGIGSRELYMRSSRSALQWVMVFAVLFKSLCTKFMEKCNMRSGRGHYLRELQEEALPQASDVSVYGVSLKDLIPGGNSQKNLLECRCLRMTEKEYDLYNHVVHGDGDEGAQTEPAPVLETQEIEESEDMGIAII